MFPNKSALEIAAVLLSLSHMLELCLSPAVHNTNMCNGSMSACHRATGPNQRGTNIPSIYYLTTSNVSHKAPRDRAGHPCRVPMATPPGKPAMPASTLPSARLKYLPSETLSYCLSDVRKTQLKITIFNIKC